MYRSIYRICVWAGAAALGLSGSTSAADAPGADAIVATSEIVGTYELVRRVLPDGKQVRPPSVAGLFTMTRGLRNFNVATRDKDGTWTSLSLIAEYTLAGGKYCQRVRFWLQNNLGNPGPSNEVPAAANDCSTVTVVDGRVTFQEPGSTPLLSFGKNALTATNAGQFVDYWQKVR